MAAVTGILTFLAHWILWALMLIFFVTSTLLTKLNRNEKESVFNISEKGGKRDIWQVIANGGILLLSALLILITEGIATIQPNNVLFLLGIASLATSTADTWATEIGTATKNNPRWILDLRKEVPKGTSGGISLIGTIGSVIGSTLIALSYFVLSLPSGLYIKEAALIMTAGVIGAMTDTLLGATLQVTYHCKECKVSTEQKVHKSCGRATKHQKGVTWMNNDLVNLISGIIASLILVFSI